MAVFDLIPNVAKGRFVELAIRVKTNDPANSVLVVVPVATGSVTAAQMRDFTSLAAVLAGGVTERTTGGWTRKVLTDADLPAITPDQVNDRADVDAPDVVWETVTGGAGNAVTAAIICYDPDSTGGTDAALIPIAVLDLPATPDGLDVVLQFDPAGFARAS